MLLEPVLKEAFPEVVNVTRISSTDLVVSLNNRSFTQSVVNVDPDFFSMFSFKLLQGSANSVLEDSRSVIITEEMSKKYFDNDDPVGKTLSFQIGENKIDLIVSGIIEKAPPNSSIQYDFLISTDLLKYSQPEEYLHSWDIIIVQTLVQLKPGVDLRAFEDIITNHVNNLSADKGYSLSYELQPLKEIHLNPDYDGISVPSSDPRYSFILSGIAFAVLLIACINFMILTIGRSANRFSEIGLRKVIGAKRFQIMSQFWGETLILSLLAVIVGVLLTELFLPTFNNLAEKQLYLGLFSNAALLPALFCLVLITSLLAGAYPALLLSNLFPIDIMKGAVKFHGKNRLTRSLIVLQFVLSTFLIVCAIVISYQLDFVRNSNLGFDKSLVVTFPTNTEGNEAARFLDRFRAELSNQPSIVDITGYSFAFGESWLYFNFTDEGGNIFIGENVTGPGFSQNAQKGSTYFYVNWIDSHFIPTLGINIIEGRNFSNEHTSDTENSIIINQTAAKIMGLENPIGKKLPRGFKNASIIGVVEDFHFYPLHRKIEPLVFQLPSNRSLGGFYEIAVRIRAENIPSTISLLDHTWRKISGGMPFNYSFLDDSIAEIYASDQRWRKIILYSSLLSILVTCLGLFGLSSLVTEKRSKEIAIRKVLGASTRIIVSMLSREFVLLILIANLVAWPLSYIVMSKWLGNFAYRIDIQPWIFVFSGLITLVITLSTISIQGIKAAVADPAETLKYE